MESFLENYTTSSGEAFNISVCKKFEPCAKTSDGLSFRAVSVGDSKDYLWGIIRISWPTKKVWDIKTGELRQVLIKLGLLRVKQALEVGNNASFDFTFSADNAGETLESAIAMETDNLERAKKCSANTKD